MYYVIPRDDAERLAVGFAESIEEGLKIQRQARDGLMPQARYFATPARRVADGFLVIERTDWIAADWGGFKANTMEEATRIGEGLGIDFAVLWQ